MHEWAEKLIVVQDADIKLAKLNEQLSQIPLKLKEADKLFADETQASNEAKKQLQQTELIIKKFESEIAQLQEKKRNFQSKSALIKSNSEYKAALLQIEMCDNAIQNQEEQQLEAMLQADSRRANLREKLKAVEIAKNRAKSVAEDLEVLRQDCQQLCQTVQEEREILQQEVEPEILQQYERLRAGRNDSQTRPCFVPVIDSTCGRCRMQVTAQTCQDAINGRQVFCPSCGALLYGE